VVRVFYVPIALEDYSIHGKCDRATSGTTSLRLARTKRERKRASVDSLKGYFCEGTTDWSGHASILSKGFFYSHALLGGQGGFVSATSGGGRSPVGVCREEDVSR